MKKINTQNGIYFVYTYLLQLIFFSIFLLPSPSLLHPFLPPLLSHSLPPLLPVSFQAATTQSDLGEEHKVGFEEYLKYM